MKLSIVVPCYNEEKNIPLLLESYGKVINRDDIEVLLVNNGSTDASAHILQGLSSKYDFLRVITAKENKGYGFGILSGLREAKGEYIGWTHGDMQTPADDVIKALELIEKRGNPLDIFVKGNRKGRLIFDQLFTLGMSFFESIYLGKRLWDINAQPNIFHRSFFEKWTNPPYDFSLDLYALYLAQTSNILVVRFNVIFNQRIHGESHWNKNFRSKIKFIKRTLDHSLTLKKQLRAGSER